MRTIVSILILTGLLSACGEQREGGTSSASALVVASPLIIKENVRVDNALSLAEQLAARTYPHKLVIYKQGDHGLTRHKQQVHQETIDWLRKYL